MADVRSKRSIETLDRNVRAEPQSVLCFQKRKIRKVFNHYHVGISILFQKMLLLRYQQLSSSACRIICKRIHVGTQHSDDDNALIVMASLGVKHICSNLVSTTFDENWSIDGLSALKTRVETHGINLAMVIFSQRLYIYIYIDCNYDYDFKVPLPLPSVGIAEAPMADIMLGNSPCRDKQISQINQMIYNCSVAGIPAVKYNLSLLGVVRTGATSGRGQSMCSTWNYDSALDKDTLTIAGEVSPEEYWERIDYFLERVVPVATECKVRLACHPHDPRMPEPQGYQGVHTVLGTPDGLKKFIEMHESAYHGLNFCQGSISEMLEDPNAEIHDLIRYFGSRGKIFNVHFRNIKGGYGSFQESFPDDGSVDMVAAIRTYDEVCGQCLPCTTLPVRVAAVEHFV